MQSVKTNVHHARPRESGALCFQIIFTFLNVVIPAKPQRSGGASWNPALEGRVFGLAGFHVVPALRSGLHGMTIGKS